MRNLEVKVAILDKKTTLAAIQGLGAVYQCTMRQQDYYFSVGARKKKLRVIDDKEYQLVTYFRIETQGRKDSQYTIEKLSEKDAKALMECEKIVQIVDKTRELWIYEHTRIHVDHVEGLGDFLELETVMTDLSLKEGEKEFAAVAEWLEIDLAGSIAASYSDMVPALD